MATDSRWLTNSGREGGGGARGRNGKPLSKGDGEDPGDKVGAYGAGNRGGEEDTDGCGGTEGLRRS